MPWRAATLAVDHLRSVKRIFKHLKYPSADAEDIFIHVLNISLENLLLKDFTITNNQKEKINQLVKRRLQGEPTAHIIGEKAFWEYTFKVTKDTLIPRPETEVLVASVLRKFREKLVDKNKIIKVLDFGCGSGCILISILKDLQKDGYSVNGLGVDMSQEAIDIANFNVKKLGLCEKSTAFLCCDWNDFLIHYSNEKFDIIVSNPPYIPSKDIQKLEVSVQNFEPHMALDGKSDGLECYRQIISILSKMDREEVIIGFEFGINQSADIRTMMTGLGHIEIIKDLSGIERVVVLQL